MIIAGVDEVGRGPLAGAVIAAAVILHTPIPGVADSKALSPKKRAQIAVLIQEQAKAYAYGRAEVDEIDSLNIHQASLLAMKRAILALSVQPTHVQVDGLHIPTGLLMSCEAFVKGDALIPVIGAASILAKVYRDAEMEALDIEFPAYGFATHKGYPTKAHRLALERYGACAIHRKSFAPVRAVLERF